MSLLDKYVSNCVFIQKVRTSDGEGGFNAVYTEGSTFGCYMALDTSVEARAAEKQGVTSTFTVLVGKDVPLAFGDIFKNSETGIYYRVTSKPEEKATPASSTLKLKFCTAERWQKP